VTFPTWGDLISSFCSIRYENSFFEDFALRRYNYAASHDKSSCRLVFLKDVLKNADNKTLCRKGRFIWCKDLRYEGKDDHGFRQISFTVDKGQKRFLVSENNILCLPSQVCVTNNRFFRSKQKMFLPFSSVFTYKNSIWMMNKNSGLLLEDFLNIIKNDTPYKPGTLVSPRVGYFQPNIDPKKIDKEISSTQEHPCGIILGPSLSKNEYVGKEFYRVRFGDTIYEKVHPVQMEIINEV
jgi:hypothetical protein